MKINKQLFEDVLAGKLEGTFVLRNGNRISTSNLKRNVNGGANIYPYRTTGYSYTTYGRAYENSMINYDIVDFIPVAFAIDPEMYSYSQKDIQFIEHFINGYHMKENELTIEIPEGKIVDWDESKKQNKIVLKDKQLTYEEICDRLPGMIDVPLFGTPSEDGNALVANEHYLACLLAKNQLANVAKYLNDGWKPDKRSDIYYLNNYCGNLVVYLTKEECSMCLGQSIFKTEELAQQAIEILGKKTIKLALEPLGF